MSAVCPQGHSSDATDYCDVCGAPIADAGAASPTAAPSTAAPSAEGAAAGTASGSATRECPNCHADSAADALFCESCGYDFTTGAMPRPAAEPPSSLDLPAGDAAAPVPPAATAAVPPAVPLEWVAEVWVDPDWYAQQESEEQLPSPGLPDVVPLVVRSVLVGRTSRSRSIHPEIDCSADVGVSRRQAQLTTDGTRWWVEDLQSANGTYVGPASGPLPTAPLVPGQRRELAEDDRVYVGAWTRLVLRRATDQERTQEPSE